MTTLEKIATGIGIVSFVFVAGAGWNSINSRFDQLGNRVEAVEKDKAKGLCLAIMNRQIVAIEKGNDSVRNQLQALSDKHCPNVTAWQTASATRPMTPEELRQQTEREQRENQQALVELMRINDELANYTETH